MPQGRLADLPFVFVYSKQPLFLFFFRLLFAYGIIEGSLESKVPTIWTDEKRSQEEAEPGRKSDMEKVSRKKIRDGERQKREDAAARKGREVAK